MPSEFIREIATQFFTVLVVATAAVATFVCVWASRSAIQQAHREAASEPQSAEPELATPDSASDLAGEDVGADAGTEPHDPALLEVETALAWLAAIQGNPDGRIGQAERSLRRARRILLARQAP